MWTVRNELTHVKKIVVYTGSVSKEKYSSDVLTWTELMALGNAQSSEGLDQRLANIAINQCSTLVWQLLSSRKSGPPPSNPSRNVAVCLGPRGNRRCVKKSAVYPSIVDTFAVAWHFPGAPQQPMIRNKIGGGL